MKERGQRDTGTRRHGEITHRVTASPHPRVLLRSGVLFSITR
ncbi:MAG: hypothetical protein RMY29_019335 [Nostoc sp. CreGUA01]|nr:hypothetical protein [Nostoc sp. CreGUA01]